MSRLILPLLLAMSLGAVAGRLAGELPAWLADSVLALKPASGLRDEAGFLQRSPAAAGRITGEIADLRAKHGFHLFLIVEPVLLTSTPQEVATLLQLDWLPDGDGMVVVYESDSRRLGFGRDLTSRFGEGRAAPHVPAAAMQAILTRAREAAAPNQSPELFIEALVVQLAREFDEYFLRLNQPVEAGSTLRLALLMIGGLAGVALAAIGVVAVHRLPANQRPRTRRFPPVDRPERLGAPCGGGHVITRRFRGR